MRTNGDGHTPLTICIAILFDRNVNVAKMDKVLTCGSLWAKWLDEWTLDTDHGVRYKGRAKGVREHKRTLTMYAQRHFCGFEMWNLSLCCYWYGVSTQVLFLLLLFLTQKWLHDGCAKCLLPLFGGFVVVSCKTKFGLTWSCRFDNSSAGDMLAKWFWYLHLHTNICLFVPIQSNFDIRSFEMEKSKIRSYESNWNANDLKCIQWFQTLCFAWFPVPFLVNEFKRQRMPNKITLELI